MTRERRREREKKREKSQDFPVYCATREKGGKSDGARDLLTFYELSETVLPRFQWPFLFAHPLSLSLSLSRTLFSSRKNEENNRAEQGTDWFARSAFSPWRERKPLGEGGKKKGETRFAKGKTRATDRKSNCSRVIRRGRPRFDRHSFHLSYPRDHRWRCRGRLKTKANRVFQLLSRSDYSVRSTILPFPARSPRRTLSAFGKKRRLVEQRFQILDFKF